MVSDLRHLRALVAVAALASSLCSGASAAVYTLFDWATNKDGTIAAQPGSPVIPSNSSILTLSFSTAGAHKALAFVDVEIDKAVNTFFNEYGSSAGAPSAGQSWEIDEPGYVFGDIYTNFRNGSLDNTNAVPSSAADDVSMALGWDFVLAAGESATVRFFLSEAAPGGFYLTHTDPDSQASLYFYSTLAIGQVPAPETLALLGIGLAGLGAARRRRA